MRLWYLALTLIAVTFDYTPPEREGQALARAGIDLSHPDTVRAVAVELDTLVARLEKEL